MTSHNKLFSEQVNYWRHQKYQYLTVCNRKERKGTSINSHLSMVL